MILNTRHQNGIVIAQITVREANLTQADTLKAEMIVLIDKYHPKKILTDFSRVEYVDSSFLGAMVSSLKYAVANGCDIAVFNLPRDIQDLFTLIRLDKVFKIYVSEAEAIGDVS